MLKTLAFAALLCAGACGGGSSTTAPTTPVAKTETMVAAPTLALGEMKIIDINKNKFIAIHADGSIELEGKTLAKVTTDGRVITTADDKTVMTLGADGSIKGPDGTDLGAKVGADGSLSMKAETVTIDETGMVKGGNTSAPPLKVEGATNAELKRTAMFVLVVMTASGEPEQTPAPTPHT